VGLWESAFENRTLSGFDAPTEVEKGAEGRRSKKVFLSVGGVAECPSMSPAT
jgi:hypothetical protein